MFSPLHSNRAQRLINDDAAKRTSYVAPWRLHGCYNNRMADHPDVLILGGGVIGLTTAYFLAREGVQVQVIDQGDLGQEASWAGAGILPPGNPARARAPFDRLRAESSVLFPTLSSELRDRTGIDNGYLRCGGLEFQGDGHDLAEQEWCGEGVACERIDEETACRMEPALTIGLGAANYLPDLAQLRNPRHL
jgi:glycine oxidase